MFLPPLFIGGVFFNVFSKSGLMEVSYEALRKVQLQEKQSSALSKLEEDFFQQYFKWLDSQCSKLKESFSLESIRLHENASKILSELVERRQQKILFKAFNDFRAGEFENPLLVEGLCKEEKELYYRLIKLFTEYKASLVAKSECPVEETPLAKTGTKEGFVKIRLLKDLQEFVGLDSVSYGPFSKNEVIEIKKEIADILLNKKAAEKAD